MSAITVQHEIAAPTLEVVAAELVSKSAALTAAADALTVADATTFEAGNRVLMDLHRVGKEIEAQRVRLKKPVTELGKLIDSISAKASEPLDAAKRTLQGKVISYQKRQEEAAAKARMEQEAIARKQREEQQAEQRRLQAEADAKAKAEAAELEAILGKPVEPEPVKVELPATQWFPPPVIPEAPKATAVQSRKVPKVIITSPRAVARFVADGGPLELLDLNHGAIKRALDAGLEVPGATIELVEVLAMAGSRT